MAIYLSKNFTLDEMCASATASAHHIPNEPGKQEIVNLVYLANKVLQPLREHFGCPIKIGSGFRSMGLNQMVGGVTGSQHLTGQAADICIDGDIAMGKKWFAWIKANLVYDQLIWEKNPKTGNYWIHVSYNAFGKNRMQVIDNLIKK